MHTQSHSKHARSHILFYIQHSSHTHNTWKWCQIKIESLFIFFLSFFSFVCSVGTFVRFGRTVVSSFENYVSIASKIPSAHTIWRMVFVSVLLLSLVELHFTSLHTHIHTCIHTETPIHSDARTHARSFNHSLIHSRMHAHIPQIHGKVKPKFMHSYKSIPLACLLASLILLGHSIEVYLARQSDDAQWYYHSVVYMCVQYATYKQQQQQQNFYLGANRFVFLFLRLLCDIRFYVAVELNISEQMRQPLSQANNSCFVFHWIQRRKNHWMPKYKNDYKKNESENYLWFV